LQQVLSPTAPPPACLRSGGSVISLIYDDVMHFTRDLDQGRSELEKLDAVYLAEGIAVAPEKDQSLELDGLACGIELHKGIGLRPKISKLRQLFETILLYCECRTCTPKQALGVNGSLQWFDLLNRPKLAGYGAMYAFGRIEPPDDSLSLPSEVAEEWLVSLLLSPAWCIDLTSEVSHEIIATDASTTFGLGVSHAHVDEQTAESLLSYDDGRGDYVTVGLPDDEKTPRARIGVARELPVNREDFADVLMIPWPHEERPEVVELRAYIAGLRWLLRSVKHIGKRQIFLLDSRVVLGAARKGRSASPALIYLMKKLSALLMLSGTLPHCLYIPTEFNPADAPSRGLRRHTKQKRAAHANTPRFSGPGVRKTNMKT
jgi:hypothetical protein